MLEGQNGSTLGHAALVGIGAISLCPSVEIGAAIDDFAAQFVKSRALHFVTPLRQLGAITDKIKLRIAQYIVAIVFEEVRHCTPSFHCIELQRRDAP